MNLYTVGFTKKTAQQFFDVLIINEIDLLLDIRLNNKTQLAGFTKGDDLAYFLREICRCAYEHKLEFAPTKDMLDAYRDKKLSWGEYEQKYTELIRVRNSEKGICDNYCKIYSQYKNIVLLCSEPTPDKCHRRLAAEAIRFSNPDICLKHL
ncbi:DUF488 domain-containing protein [Synergistaceae bacterium OttesenSCG-928-I11]|nr:DUF488 domain-containing protein [Synergistaceae bacterium OttesenSCG-928-I11]